MRTGLVEKKLRFEALEQKRVLAGNVLASVSGGGDLELIEDPNATGTNSFTVSGGPSSYLITPDTGTTINGSSTAVTIPGVTGDIIAETGDGNDAIKFEDLTAAASIRVDLGTTTVAGQVDSVSFRRSTVPGSIIVDAGDTDSDGSQVTLGDLVVGNDVVLFTGSGNNTAVIGESFPLPAPVDIGDDLRIYGGAGDIAITGDLVTIGDDFRVAAGSGAVTIVVDDVQVNDDFRFVGDAAGASLGVGGLSVGDDAFIVGSGSSDVFALGGSSDEAIVGGIFVGDNLRLFARGGDDLVEVIEAEVGSAALVSLGYGEDAVGLFGSDFGYGLSVFGYGTNTVVADTVTTSHYINIVTGSGNDFVDLNLVTTHIAWISTHGGDDDVLITDSTFDYLFALLGSGDDTLTLDGVTVERFGVVSGGSGTDTLNDPDETENVFVFNFEAGDV